MNIFGSQQFLLSLCVVILYGGSGENQVQKNHVSCYSTRWLIVLACCGFVQRCNFTCFTGMFCFFRLHVLLRLLGYVGIMRGSDEGYEFDRVLCCATPRLLHPLQ